MLGVLLSGLVLLVVGAAISAITDSSPVYGSKLEDYIVSHNPKDCSDVERLTKEFDQKLF